MREKWQRAALVRPMWEAQLKVHNLGRVQNIMMEKEEAEYLPGEYSLPVRDYRPLVVVHFTLR